MTEEWQSDPEIGGGAEEHVLVDTAAMRAGLSRFASDADPEPPPCDMASLPKGAVTRWRLTPPFKEMWVLA